MDVKTALAILGIESELTLTTITKRYRKLALQHHPDKNGNTPESNERFQSINEAYQFVKNNPAFLYDDDTPDDDTPDDDTPDDDASATTSVYMTVLTRFIQSVMDGHYSDIIANIVNDLLHKGSLSLFEELDKDTALNIYIFLSRYKTILYVRDELLDSVKQMVMHKYDNVCIYKLNPSIHDLMHNNFYKLHVQDQLYLVPLWHPETYYDGSGCEIIAICEPDLPPNVVIDEDNNLRVDVEVNAHQTLAEMVLHTDAFTICIGSESINIPLNELRLTREQHCRLKGCGLVNIKKDLYDLSDKSDMIVRIRFV